MNIELNRFYRIGYWKHFNIYTIVPNYSLLKMPDIFSLIREKYLHICYFTGKANILHSSYTDSIKYIAIGE